MFREISGETGKIENPAVGLLIGEMRQWHLKARTDENPGPGQYVLRASFSALVDWMFNDAAIPRRIVIEIGRGNQYRLEVADDARTELDGQSLLIEGVNLCRLD